MTEAHLKPLNEKIINIWLARGYDVTQPEHRLVAGLPISVKRLTTRKGNAKLSGVVYLDDLNLKMPRRRRRIPEISPVETLQAIYPSMSKQDAALIVDETEADGNDRAMVDNFARILKEVCDKHGVLEGAIRSQARKRKLTYARFELFARLSDEISMPLAAIGRAVGGRNHSTVISGIKRHRELGGEVAPERPRHEPREFKTRMAGAKSVKKIIAGVAKKYDITVMDIMGSSRLRAHSYPRFECYFKLRFELSMSYSKIGEAMGGRDHSTIRTGIQKYRKLYHAVNASPSTSQPKGESYA